MHIIYIVRSVHCTRHHVAFHICRGLIKLSRTSPVCCDYTPDLLRRSPNSGESFASSRTEEPTTSVTAQRNRSYEYSRTFLKIATNRNLTDLGK